MNLNCDQVFDILTRGPFPSGQPTDEPAERHIAACHECRCLAEALRPAVDLFHEALQDDEVGLPGYHGALEAASCERISTAVMTAIHVSTPPENRVSPSSPPATAQSRIWQVAAVALLSSALCFLLAATGIPNTATDQDAVQDKLVVTPAVLRRQPDETAVQYLLSLVKGSSCQPDFVASVTNPQTGESSLRTVYHCCTLCHAAQRDQMETGAVARLTRSCAACHTE